MEVDEAFVECEPMGINFLSLEMRDLDEPSVLRSTYGHRLSEFEIYTESGIPFRVYVQKGKGTPIFTLHDIGTNYHSFVSFFSCPEMKIILEQFSVYHICAPGHHDTAGSLEVDRVNKEEGDSLLPGSEESRGSVFTIYGKNTQSASVQYPTMDLLADMLGAVVAHFNLKYFIGFGMGAGSNVLARYALKNPEHVLGLFLLNPTASTAGYFQWFRNKWSDLPQLQKGIVTDSIVQQLESHWFGANNSRDSQLVEPFVNHLRSLHPSNVAGYIQSYMNRTDLGITRPTSTTYNASAAAAGGTGPPVIAVDTCLVTGEKAGDLRKAMTDMNGRMDPTKTQFMIMTDCTGMVMEEAPDRLALNFLHFLRNIGLVINITPEKLRQQVAGQTRSQSTTSSDFTQLADSRVCL